MLGPALIMLLGASDVSLRVAPGVVCIERGRVEARLEQNGLVVRERSDRLAVTIELRATNLVVRGVKRDGAVLERAVPAKVDDCGAIERVVVALITSWSQAVPVAAPAQRDARQQVSSAAPGVDGDSASAALVGAADAAAVGRRADATSPPGAGSGASAGPGVGSAAKGTTFSPGDSAARADATSSAGSAARTDAPSSPVGSAARGGAAARVDASSPSGAGGASAEPAVGSAAKAGATPSPGDSAAKADATTSASTAPRADASSSPVGSAERADVISAAVGSATKADANSSLNATSSPGVDSASADGSSPSDAPPAAAVLGTNTGPIPGIVPTRLELGVAALGGASIGPTASVTGSGQATVSLSFGRAGLSLDVGLASARSRAIDGVSVESASQWASLSGVISFRPLERLRLALSLGPRVWRITAATTGAEENGTLALASFGGVGAAYATVRLFGPLSLAVQLFVSARWRAERFTVTNLGSVLELLPWEGGALGGLQLDASL